jgi:myo-inositol 2-dehydrogenase / D-chiro-inositol 1-dehydrogenase
MLRIAMLGAGRVGQVHARSVVAHPEAELALVVDPIEAAAKALGEQHGATWSLDPEDAFSDPSIDAVIIGTPTNTHIDMLKRAVAAGKKTLLEKPIDLDLGQIDAAWAAIEASAPFVMLGFCRRFDPSFGEVRERVAKGEIGTIRALRITSRDPQPPPAAYLAVSGGMFKDMTIHDFDMARFQVGDIVEVSAVASDNGLDAFKQAKDHAQAIVTMRAASGALVTIVNSRSCAYGYDQRLEAFGDLGSLEAGNWTATTVRAATATQTEAAGPILNFFLERYLPAFQAEFGEFVQAIKEDRTPAVGFADGRAALVLAEAASESVATGRAVKIG